MWASTGIRNDTDIQKSASCSKSKTKQSSRLENVLGGGKQTRKISKFLSYSPKKWKMEEILHQAFFFLDLSITNPINTHKKPINTHKKQRCTTLAKTGTSIAYSCGMKSLWMKWSLSTNGWKITRYESNVNR